MNKYDKIIIFIFLKICRIMSKHSSDENMDTKIYAIEQMIGDDNDKI